MIFKWWFLQNMSKCNSYIFRCIMNIKLSLYMYCQYSFHSIIFFYKIRLYWCCLSCYNYNYIHIMNPSIQYKLIYYLLKIIKLTERSIIDINNLDCLFRPAQMRFMIRNAIRFRTVNHTGQQSFISTLAWGLLWNLDLVAIANNFILNIPGASRKLILKNQPTLYWY